jgi:hypothetical protein
MPFLSVEEQDRRLRAECPQFKLVAHAGWMGIWEGTLKPTCQTYRIRIVYFSRRFFDGWHLTNHYISVFVVDLGPIMGPPEPRPIPAPLLTASTSTQARIFPARAPHRSSRSGGAR